MKKVLIVNIIFFIIFFHNCNKNQNPIAHSYSSDYTELIEMGWNSFEKQNYNESLFYFSRAYKFSQDNVEVFSGLGWSLIKLNYYQSAFEKFQKGKIISVNNANLLAGLAFYLNINKQYSESNSEANKVLEIDQEWEFDHGLNLNFYSIHLLKAQNYFILGEFENCLRELQFINPEFQVDINLLEGKIELANEIERLSSIYSINYQ